MTKNCVIMMAQEGLYITTLCCCLVEKRSDSYVKSQPKGCPGVLPPVVYLHGRIFSPPSPLSSRLSFHTSLLPSVYLALCIKYITSFSCPSIRHV